MKWLLFFKKEIRKISPSQFKEASAINRTFLARKTGKRGRRFRELATERFTWSSRTQKQECADFSGLSDGISYIFTVYVTVKMIWLRNQCKFHLANRISRQLLYHVTSIELQSFTAAWLLTWSETCQMKAHYKKYVNESPRWTATFNFHLNSAANLLKFKLKSGSFL